MPSTSAPAGVMLLRAGVLLLVCCVVAAEESDGYMGPTVKYALVVNEDGISGNCRGNSGSADMVNSKSKRLGRHAQCKAECDGLSSCVGYTYSPASESCTIHGEGMSGTCSLEGKNSMNECGMCSQSGKDTKSTCGSCSVKPSSGWVETENFCRSSDGLWTAATWTEGTWTAPTGGWTGDSHRTTHVHTVDGAADAYCYDKYPYDGVAQCKATVEAERDQLEHFCQKEFDIKQDTFRCPFGCEHSAGTAATDREPAKPPSCVGRQDLDCAKKFNDAAVAADCSGSCSYVPQPMKTRTTNDVHAPILYLPGWEKELRSTGDTVGTTFPKGTIGMCAVEGIGAKTINNKRCATCTASNGMSVGVQEGCAQACLDDPSGACVAYAHSSFDCILYSPNAHEHLVHDNGDTWTSDARATKPCISYDSPKVFDT